jgi:hypothetical protein
VNRLEHGRDEVELALLGEIRGRHSGRAVDGLLRERVRVEGGRARGGDGAELGKGNRGRRIRRPSPRATLRPDAPGPSAAAPGSMLHRLDRPTLPISPTTIPPSSLRTPPLTHNVPPCHPDQQQDAQHPAGRRGRRLRRVRSLSSPGASRRSPKHAGRRALETDREHLRLLCSVAMNCYDLQSCIGTIRAAEKLRAPAIIEVRPLCQPA